MSQPQQESKINSFELFKIKRALGIKPKISSKEQESIR